MLVDNTSDVSGADPRPPLEITQNNVGLANTYRLELNKQLVAVATALFAFTVTFYGTPAPGTPPVGSVRFGFAVAGWITLGISILCGLFVFRAWERYYISYRDFDNKEDREAGKKRRAAITAVRHIALGVQYLTFVLGIVCVALFASFRLSGP